MKLKVGDRIHVYGAYSGTDGVLFGGNLKGATQGVVVEVSSHYVDFKASDGWVFSCHIKQVRKIKERKRIWVNEYDTFLASSIDTRVQSARKAFVHYTKEEADREADNDRVSCTEFVEVRKK